MPDVTINLTREAVDAIRSALTTGWDFRETAVLRSDGTFDVPVSQETFNRIEMLRLKGESRSDLIVRLVAFFKFGGRAQ